ncbi:hypothetical protein A2361_02110 [Candidatus Woesebacteria bacterium RIFOXYB1_FULL_40_26]|uniref:Type II secretion system protein GspG C-terminal domain-containing protein n=1 Tax=Candidatus Woesebacteria bacterium RIFOXYB1_FULL_40_26 TaxID=1802539 RepID=A0A1F8CUA4_9BACT|nr:MAG: hypothetical protein A2361_02110 [Candidatus Woesebacteria bacterium RIFOXYB1_FULL_40_26]
MSKQNSGFTLIELLVVIGILGILLAIVLIAINPAAQFAQANNTARTNDVNTILNAIHQYSADNRGLLPTGIPVDDGNPANGSEALEIKKDADDLTSEVDICAILVPDYVSLLPVDPDTNNGIAVADCTANYSTRYLVAKDANGRVTVSAPDVEAVRGTSTPISITR